MIIESQRANAAGFGQSVDGLDGLRMTWGSMPSNSATTSPPTALISTLPTTEWLDVRRLTNERLDVRTLLTQRCTAPRHLGRWRLRIGEHSECTRCDRPDFYKSSHRHHRNHGGSRKRGGSSPVTAGSDDPNRCENGGQQRRHRLHRDLRRRITASSLSATPSMRDGGQPTAVSRASRSKLMSGVAR